MFRRWLLTGVAALCAAPALGHTLLLGGVGRGTPLSLAPPGAVSGLTKGTITSNTVPLSWSAASGSPTPTYTVQYRVTGSSIWVTAASGIAGTSYTVAGLIGGLDYSFQVFATNTLGSGAAASTTATPTADGSSMLYWGNGGYPNTSIVHGSTNNAIVLYINNSGSLTSAKFGWSLTQVDPPSTLQAMTEYNTSVWGTFSGNAPASAGTYYGWMIFYDSGGNARFAVIATTGQTYQNGGAITPAVTVT